MEPYKILLLTSFSIWFIVFVMIVWQDVIDGKHRRVVTRLPLWKVLLIGILWPFVCIGVPLWLFLHIKLRSLTDNDPFDHDNK